MPNAYAVAALCWALVSDTILAQSYAVGWGPGGFDTRSAGPGFVQVRVQWATSIQRRSDGAIFVNGGQAEPPPQLPTGVTFVDCDIGDNANCYALRSDGQITQWGKLPPYYSSTKIPVPPLPAGLSYLQVAASRDDAVALRSDGTVVTWGQNATTYFSPPSPPTGTVFTRVSAGTSYMLALTLDGRVTIWGVGTPTVPTLPNGVYYTDIATGYAHALLLRSDGQVEAIGVGTDGQTAVPPLPPGQTYVAISTGANHSIARRSDGTWLAWGLNTDGQCNIPPEPAGMTYVSVDGGFHYTVALRSDGRVVGWGQNMHLMVAPLDLVGSTRIVDTAASDGNSLAMGDDGIIHAWGASTIQATHTPPIGLGYVGCSAGHAHNLLLRSDGMLIAHGDNSVGQSSIPPLPPGTRYTAMDAGYSHSVALRSDGVAVAFGSPSSAVTVPPPPAGTRYTAASAISIGTLLVRSDGVVIAYGNNISNRFNFPPPPGGLAYRKAVGGQSHGCGLLTDGSIVMTGLSLSGVGYSTSNPPPLPPGVVFVDVASGYHHVIARTSDGNVVHWGQVAYFQDLIPPIPAGFSCLDIDTSTMHQSAALYGPASTYVTIANGCAGSRPATRLIPFDTPRIGHTLEVNLLDLPADLAFLVFGWSTVPPINMSPLGMPGCTSRLSVDAVALVTGSNHSAVFQLPIPYSPSLVGIEFFHQAFVPDPNTNALGAVLSDTAHARIGW
jgi:alpha-tubulin suppressor-like RCC1 family protein